jgi:hypothetical protein
MIFVHGGLNWHQKTFFSTKSSAILKKFFKETKLKKIFLLTYPTDVMVKKATYRFIYYVCATS